ncbi:MAG: baseplate J/gp47 family protein [Candidatus Dormibacteraeota bacterium]|nr:baseplate J/gp47 family protein [Candidatus Dormibacteraeota bacterium]
MKTLAKLLYVEADEEITDLVDRLRDLSLEEEVTFVVPERARSLQSAMSFRLLKRYADSYGKRVNLVSADPRLQAMSLEAGFTAFPSLAAYDRGTEVHRPELAGEPSSAAATATAPAPSAVALTAPPTSPANAAQRGVATLDRPREASVMSAPPKRQAPAPRKPAASGPPLGSYRPYLIGAAVLAVIGLLVGLLYLPTATATVAVQGTPIKADVQLLGAPGVAAGSPDRFATQAIHAEESQNLPGTPTGQKQIDAAKATGQVTFKASCSGFICTIPIRAGTDVSTGSGKHYVTTKSVTVQSTLVSQGSVDAPVAAVQAGAAGNTEVDTIRYINNNNPDDLLSVNNAQAISGGADARTATVIQQSDMDSIRDVYAKDALPRVTDQLTGKAQGKKLVLVGNGVQATAKADHAVGDEVGGFTVTIKVAGDGVAFDDKAVQQQLKGFLQRKVPQGSQLTTDGTTIKYDPSDMTADGHITLNGHTSGFYTPIFLESAIRSHLKGMSPSKGRAFLQSLPNVVDARVTQSPFGLPWLPLFSSRITLKIQEVSSTNASP